MFSPPSPLITFAIAAGTIASETTAVTMTSLPDELLTGTSPVDCEPQPSKEPRARLRLMSELDSAVRAVVRDCLAVRTGEEVVVVCDPGTRPLAGRLRDEAAEAGAEA